MKYVKIIVVSLLVLCGELSFADFSTPEEFITAIKQFSEEEFGIRLVFDTTTQVDSVGYDTIYSLYVCPKSKFWNNSDPIGLFSFETYKDMVYLDSLEDYYQSHGYDFFRRKLAPSSVAIYGRLQYLPDLSKITTKKITTILHEAFHYHFIQQGIYLDNNTSIKRCSVEEGAATVFGLMAAKLFVEKFYSAKSVQSWVTQQRIRDYDQWFQNVHALYNWLKDIYQDDLSDSIKIQQAQAVFDDSDYDDNAELSKDYLYAQYYFAFRNVWRKYDSPREAVARFVQIVKQQSF